MLPANPPGGGYAKGKGVEFEDWRAKNKGEALFLCLERAEGGRQDLAFDGALPLFVNRMVLLQFLRDAVFVPGHANILEDALCILLRSNEVTAALRVVTLFDLLLSRQMRYISGKSDALKDWSIYSMSDVLDGVEAILILIAEDGQVLLLRPTPRAWSALSDGTYHSQEIFNPALDFFEDIAEKQPLFKAWRADFFDTTMKSPNGTKHKVYQLALDEARDPIQAGNEQATLLAIELAETMANAALAKCHDKKLALSSWLTSQNGENSMVNRTAEHEATKGACTTNDRVESALPTLLRACVCFFGPL